MRIGKRIVATMAVAMFATAGIATSAAAEVAGRPADVPAVELTAAQRQALQAQVTAHLDNYGGGTQVGINQIAYDNGKMILTLPLPGETRARAINEPKTALGTANCAGANACLWSDTNFNGTRIQREACTTLTLAAPFNSSTGSIHNNQTPGTQTVLMNASRQILNATLAPSRVHDTGVGTRSQARFWRVC